MAKYTLETVDDDGWFFGLLFFLTIPWTTPLFAPTIASVVFAFSGTIHAVFGIILVVGTAVLNWFGLVFVFRISPSPVMAIFGVIYSGSIAYFLLVYFGLTDYIWIAFLVLLSSALGGWVFYSIAEDAY